MNNEVLSIVIVIAFILVVLGVRWLVSFAMHKGVDMASDALERRNKTSSSGQVSLAQRYGQTGAGASGFKKEQEEETS